MRKIFKILKNDLGTIVFLFGVITLFDLITKGDDPNNELLLKFSVDFQALHNTVMQSYLALTIRIMMIVCGLLMLTRRYWLIGLLLYMPFAVNILCIHLFYDIPPAHIFFFSSGVLVSIPAFILLWMETERLKILRT